MNQQTLTEADLNKMTSSALAAVHNQHAKAAGVPLVDAPDAAELLEGLRRVGGDPDDGEVGEHVAHGLVELGGLYAGAVMSPSGP